MDVDDSHEYDCKGIGFLLHGIAVAYGDSVSIPGNEGPLGNVCMGLGCLEIESMNNLTCLQRLLPLRLFKNQLTCFLFPLLHASPGCSWRIAHLSDLSGIVGCSGFWGLGIRWRLRAEPCPSVLQQRIRAAVGSSVSCAWNRLGIRVHYDALLSC